MAGNGCETIPSEREPGLSDGEEPVALPEGLLCSFTFSNKLD